MSVNKVDFVIIGAGIVGLSIARQLVSEYPNARIVVLEKENAIGLHASGRNSGVLHAGLYYPAESLKAKFCIQGARALAAYCEEHQLPLHRIGKIIVPQQACDDTVVDLLHHRAAKNGVKTKFINREQLHALDPFVQMHGERALFSPETAVVDPHAILQKIYDELLSKGVEFFFKSPCTRVEWHKNRLHAARILFDYGHLFNAAGLYADRIAVMCGMEDRYTVVPFKGVYYELAPDASVTINHLIYLAPDLNVPFLGVHLTKNIQGKVYVGPTAFPVFSRENYTRWKGVNSKEFCEVMQSVLKLYWQNKQGFRRYFHHEIPYLWKPHFVQHVRRLLPGLQKNDLLSSAKVGIRAQLVDRHTGLLVTDFLIKNTLHATHILNAVSPAFTSAFSCAQWVVNRNTAGLQNIECPDYDRI